MIVRPSQLFAVIWMAWIASWLAASFWSARTEKRAATAAVWTYRVCILAGAVLLAKWTARALGEDRIWHVGYDGAYALAGITFAGVVLTWWARIHLGRFWSGAITRKAGHRIIDSGPYAFVRHPIYTGLIVAIVATTAALATMTALAGAALVAVGLWLKARAEERFLTAELDADAYGAYRRRVPMLVPFWRHG